MNSKHLTRSFVAISALLTNTAMVENELDPIVVSVDFREAKLYDKTSQSFAETLSSTPNVNFSSAASKGKYIQIRGIGERGQFVTPINPSVGINIDGIDFSNSALGITTFDTEQIEVLRGLLGQYGNNPGNGYISELYTQQGTPRTFGVTVRYDY